MIYNETYQSTNENLGIHSTHLLTPENRPCCFNQYISGSSLTWKPNFPPEVLDYITAQHTAQVKQVQQQAPQAPHSPEHAQQPSPALRGDDVPFND
jgi:hypothetical protein